MTQIDEKFKDASPVQTVERIQNILKKNGFTYSEKAFDSGLKHCHTIRLTLDGSLSASNGKGVTPELARASAYAELMERLQSNHKYSIGNVNTSFADAVYFSADELIEHCGEYFTAIAKSNPKSDGSIATEAEIAEVCLALDGGEKAKVIPFYNATAKKLSYFPMALRAIYSSTGLAAGNSPEEALVQGLSEIFERHSKLKLMRDKTVPPTIPEEYLKQFGSTYEMIEEIRAAGYDVCVKDCSLGSPFPVLATVLIDKRSHSYHVHLGSHPIFEIALRRTLTETFQGRTLTNVTSLDNFISSNEYTATDIEIVKSITKSQGSYPVEFFGESDTVFVPYKDRGNMTNNELLAEMIYFLSSSGFSVLVRDHGCLGFDTYRIIVPGFCEVFPFLLECAVPEAMTRSFYEMLPGKYTDIPKEKAKMRIKVEQQRLTHSVKFTFTDAFKCPINLDAKTNRTLYYLNLAYLYWAADEKKNIFSFLSTARLSAPEYDGDYLHCLEKWLKLRPKYSSDAEIIELLSPFYKADVLCEVKDAVNRGNPFKKYAHSCDDIDCSNCKYKSICTQEGKDLENSKINKAIAAFDDAAAFERLKNLFNKIL